MMSHFTLYFHHPNRQRAAEVSHALRPVLKGCGLVCNLRVLDGPVKGANGGAIIFHNVYLDRSRHKSSQSFSLYTYLYMALSRLIKRPIGADRIQLFEGYDDQINLVCMNKRHAIKVTKSGRISLLNHISSESDDNILMCIGKDSYAKCVEYKEYIKSGKCKSSKIPKPIKHLRDSGLIKKQLRSLANKQLTDRYLISREERYRPKIEISSRYVSVSFASILQRTLNDLITLYGLNVSRVLINCSIKQRDTRNAPAIEVYRDIFYSAVKNKKELTVEITAYVPDIVKWWVTMRSGRVMNARWPIKSNIDDLPLQVTSRTEDGKIKEYYALLLDSDVTEEVSHTLREKNLFRISLGKVAISECGTKSISDTTTELVDISLA